jgi:hypothetical protein
MSADKPVRGDVVRVRSREEILATLDSTGSLRGLPFMPEMLDLCGQEVPIQSVAHKTCDVIGLTGTTRRLTDTVHLQGSRCSGAAHGGCQAGCLIFWREEWLESPERPGIPLVPAPKDAPGVTEAQLDELVQTVREPGADPVYRCQATDITEASTHLRAREIDQYVTDVRSGNVSLWFVLRGLIIDVFNKYQKVSRRFPKFLQIGQAKEFPFYGGTGTGERTPRLHLQPGETVEIRSKSEIMATLGPDNKNRGMWFDQEQLPLCGTRAVVDRQVSRIVDERTGEIIKLGDAVVLTDVICEGRYRKSCPRAFTPYWREAWLRRVDEAPAAPEARTSPENAPVSAADGAS